MITRIVTTISACPKAPRGPVLMLAASARSPRGNSGTSASAAAIAPASTNATSFRKPVGARPPRSTHHMRNDPPTASSVRTTDSTMGSVAIAESLPFADSTFDVAVAGFVIRNVGDIPQGLREMRRVLRPGGRAVILDLHTPRNPTIRRLYRSYSFISPRLASVLGSDPEAYRYLPRSIEAFHDPETLAALLRHAGFVRVRFERLTFGIAAIHLGEA